MDLADYGQAGPAGEEEQGVLWGWSLGNHAWKRGFTPGEEDMQLLVSMDGQGCGSGKQSEDGRLEATGRLWVSEARAHMQTLARVAHLEAAVVHNRLRELDTHHQMAVLVPLPCLPGHDDGVAETRQTTAVVADEDEEGDCEDEEEDNRSTKPFRHLGTVSTLGEAITMHNEAVESIGGNLLVYGDTHRRFDEDTAAARRRFHGATPSAQRHTDSTTSSDIAALAAACATVHGNAAVEAEAAEVGARTKAGEGAVAAATARATTAHGTEAAEVFTYLQPHGSDEGHNDTRRPHRSQGGSPNNDNDNPLGMFASIVDILFAVVDNAAHDPGKCKRGWCDTPSADAGGFCNFHNPLRELQDVEIAAKNELQRLQRQRLPLTSAGGSRAICPATASSKRARGQNSDVTPAIATTETLQEVEARMDKGTIKGTCFAMLKTAGPQGLLLTDIVEPLVWLGLKDWSSVQERFRQVANTVNACCRDDPAFVKVAPGRVGLAVLGAKWSPDLAVTVGADDGRVHAEKVHLYCGACKNGPFNTFGMRAHDSRWCQYALASDKGRVHASQPSRDSTVDVATNTLMTLSTRRKEGKKRLVEDVSGALPLECTDAHHRFNGANFPASAAAATVASAAAGVEGPSAPKRARTDDNKENSE
jgi:hypothetical protein